MSEWTRDYLFDLYHGLLRGLQDGQSRGLWSELTALERRVRGKFNHERGEHRAVKLYVAVAARKSGESHDDLIAEFGAPVVADVLRELRSSPSRVGRPANGDDERSVGIPLMLVKLDGLGNPYMGVPAGLRLDWVSEPTPINDGEWYWTPSQLHLDRDASAGEGSWMAAERKVHLFMAARLAAGRPVGDRFGSSSQHLDANIRCGIYLENPKGKFPLQLKGTRSVCRWFSGSGGCCPKADGKCPKSGIWIRATSWMARTASRVFSEWRRSIPGENSVRSAVRTKKLWRPSTDCGQSTLPWRPGRCNRSCSGTRITVSAEPAAEERSNYCLPTRSMRPSRF